MSIASNVIDENTKLGTARGLLREKLAANGIYYSNSDSIFQLMRRWNLKYADISFNTPYSSNLGKRGNKWVRERFIEKIDEDIQDKSEIRFISSSYLDNIYLDRKDYENILWDLIELHVSN